MNFIGNGVQAFALQNTPGINIHIFREALIGIGVGANLDHRRQRRAHYRAAPGRKQDYMRPTGDHFRDLGIVIDVGKPETHLAVRHHIQQIQPPRRGNITGFDQADDRGGAGFGIGPHGFFFDG